MKSQPSEFLTESREDGGIAVLTLDRPPVNALNSAFLQAIERRLAELEGDADLRALVMTGAGKTLSGGMDLKELQGFSVADQNELAEAFSRTFAKLYVFPKPVVAAVNGAAIAGGLFVALASDYRVARAGAWLGLTEVRVGVRFPAGPLEVARQELSASAARRLMLGGQNVRAEQALEMGILDEVVAADQVMTRAMEMAAEYSKIPPATYAAVKAQLRGHTAAAILEAVDSRSDPTLKGWFSEETYEAARALLGAARSG